VYECADALITYLIAFIILAIFVRVGKVNMTSCPFHDRLRVLALSADDVRMVSKRNIDFQVDAVLLQM
jgi:hypothetical protein